MPIRARPIRQKSEPTVALINIVFLLLVFFMIAGTLAPPLDGNIALVDTSELDGRAPPDAAVIRPDGIMSFRGALIDAAGYIAAMQEFDGSVRIVPDRNLPAKDLARLVGNLRAAGAGAVWIVTERGLQ